MPVPSPEAVSCNPAGEHCSCSGVFLPTLFYLLVYYYLVIIMVVVIILFVSHSIFQKIIPCKPLDIKLCSLHIMMPTGIKYF